MAEPPDFDMEHFMEGWPTVAELLDEIMADPPPLPPPKLPKLPRTPQDRSGYVERKMRQWNGQDPKPKPYLPWQRVKVALFFVVENRLHRLPVPADILALLETFTPAEERELIEALDRLGIE